MNATAPESSIATTAETPNCNLSTIIIQMESVDGFSAPVNIASSLDEMEELCASHFNLLNPDEDICPSRYVGFARDGSGKFQAIATIEI